MGIRTVPAAAPAGFVSLFGRIEAGTGISLNLPEGMVNIGGNGKGYVLEQKTDWELTLISSHNDGSFNTLGLGDDIYIYAVQDPSGVARWIASINSTVPNGYTASNSRKIGGAHYGRTRSMSQRYTASVTGYNILPNSCWDLQHRPTCDPTGMMELPNGPWLSIYLLSAGAGSWPENTLVSRYAALPVTGSEGYMEQEHAILLANSGMRLPTYNEMTIGAYGVPAGSSGGSGRVNTGNMNGYGFDATSCYGMDQPAGNVYQLCADRSGSSGTSNAWNDSFAGQGKDGAYDRGQWYGEYFGLSLFGAHWAAAAQAGGLTAYLTGHPWGVGTNVGVRGACDSL